MSYFEDLYYTGEQTYLGHIWSVGKFIVDALVITGRATSRGERAPTATYVPLRVTDASARITLDLLALVLADMQTSKETPPTHEVHIDAGWDYSGGNAVRVILPDLKYDTEKDNQYARCNKTLQSLHGLGTSHRAAPYQDIITFDGDTSAAVAEAERRKGIAVWYANGLSMLCNYMELPVPKTWELTDEQRILLLRTTTGTYNYATAGIARNVHLAPVLQYLVTHVYGIAGSLLFPANGVFGSTHPADMETRARLLFSSKDEKGKKIEDTAITPLMLHWPRILMAWADQSNEEGASTIDAVQQISKLTHELGILEPPRGPGTYKSFADTTRAADADSLRIDSLWTGAGLLAETLVSMRTWLQVDRNKAAVRAWQEQCFQHGCIITFAPDDALPETNENMQIALQTFHLLSTEIVRMLRLSGMSLAVAALQKHNAILGDLAENDLLGLVI